METGGGLVGRGGFRGVTDRRWWIADRRRLYVCLLVSVHGAMVLCGF